jgi:hypothetical protein
MQGKLLRQVLDKMMTSGHAQNARVQVLLPDGKYYDITSLQLLENKLIGVRERHTDWFSQFNLRHGIWVRF